jgi:N,N'-diacetyllegionaminate synthase
MGANEQRKRVVVIAEIGVNHNGSLALAKELVIRCVESGADYAKFQTFIAKNLASENAPVANYQKKSFVGERQVDLLSSLELSESDFEGLVAHCATVGIGFLTTAHDLGSAVFVMGLGSDFIKVPSGDVTNYPFLRLVATQRTPVLLSTGASRADEVFQAIEVLESEGLSRSQITVMQCTTEYPAPLEEANLLAMVEMGKEWGVSVGYSDHTSGQDAAIAAVALGATVIEKHITLDRDMEGPDHAASLEPAEFAEMVTAIRQVEKALGSNAKGVTSAEEHNRDVIRKSIVARTHIEVGEPFSEENLGVMRPGTGLSPMHWPQLIGQVAKRSYGPSEMIELT